MPRAEGAAVLAAAAFATMLYLSRRRRRRFAPMETEPPPATLEALGRHRWMPLRHGVVRDAVSPAALEAAFDAIRAAFAPQQVDYSNTAYGKDHWKLSCFMEYTNGVAAKKVDLEQGAPLMAACAGILAECDRVFLRWHGEQHPLHKSATRSLHRLQSFVTRYRPNADETHLPRHIDGANVDGSLVLGLPTYDGFGRSGGLTVWDGDKAAEVFEYPVAAGEAVVLGSRVWHQSNPIACGERWVIVIFYQVTDSGGPAKKAPADDKASRAAGVRELLAKRMVDAARRKAASEQALEAERAGPAGDEGVSGPRAWAQS